MPILQTALRRRSSIALISARLAAFFAVLGPGFVTANVDNDPGGILTYSQAGAEFGYQLLWTLIPTTIALIVVQEMAARMGAITGKGLADLIREEFGLRATFFVMVVLGVADFGNIMAEFAGLASGMGIFGVSKYLVVPVCAATLYVNGNHNITDAADAALALKPLAGRWASLLFAVGLANAAMLSAAILPLATAYNICEGLGVESGVNKKFSEAPTFYWIYT